MFFVQEHLQWDTVTSEERFKVLQALVEFLTARLVAVISSQSGQDRWYEGSDLLQAEVKRRGKDVSKKQARQIAGKYINAYSKFLEIVSNKSTIVLKSFFA